LHNNHAIAVELEVKLEANLGSAISTRKPSNESKQRANELKTVPADEKSTMQAMMIEKSLRKTGEIEEREQSEWKSKNKNS